MQRVLQAQTLAGLRRRVVIRDFIRLQRVDHIEDANAGLEITTGQRGWIGAPVDSAVVRLVTERTVANGIRRDRKNVGEGQREYDGGSQGSGRESKKKRRNDKA